jgi:NAD(P)-dependent dehydrogenase (short-subunit alcohol dehydrogenase family)
MGPSRPDGEALRERVVLVTGSGRGLGASLARSAARARARVVVNYRQNQHGAEALTAELRRAGADVVSCRADVTDYDQACALVDRALGAYGRIDVLVNTVGVFSWKSVDEMDAAEWRRVMASNLDSVYNMCRLALPHMRKAHWGRIVNLAAVGAERTVGQPKVAAYSAAKAAVVAFSKALALEEARSGITVNVVSPGVLLDGEERTPTPGSSGSNLADRVPVGRPGTPDDVSRAILFFASPAADFVTGQVVAVAGGWGL